MAATSVPGEPKDDREGGVTTRPRASHEQVRELVMQATPDSLVALVARLERDRGLFAEEDLGEITAAVLRIKRDPSWTPARERVVRSLERIRESAREKLPDAILDALDGHGLRRPKLPLFSMGFFAAATISALLVTALGVERSMFSRELRETISAFGSLGSGVLTLVAAVGIGAVFDEELKGKLRAVLRAPVVLAFLGCGAATYTIVMIVALQSREYLVLRCTPGAPWEASAELVFPQNQHERACGYEGWVHARERIHLVAPTFTTVSGTAAELLASSAVDEHGTLQLAPLPFVRVESDPQQTPAETGALADEWCRAGEPALVAIDSRRITLSLVREVPDDAALTIELRRDLRDSVGETLWAVEVSPDLKPGCNIQEVEQGRVVPLGRACLDPSRDWQVTIYTCAASALPPRVVAHAQAEGRSIVEMRVTASSRTLQHVELR